MDIFKLKGSDLSLIEKENFSLEKDLQNIIERNLENLFSLQFISNEFAVGGFKIDTLAFDNEAKSFVIIEYKNRKTFSVIDQGYSYLSTMLNKKADFILEYNERKKETLKRGDIDWASSRILFVSPSFSLHQKNSVNFKDLPFELWEVQKFASGLISIEKHQTDSKESVKSLTKEAGKSVIDDISSKIKVYGEEDHTKKTSESAREAWELLREKIEELPDISVYGKRDYMGFKRRNKVVCIVYFKSDSLGIELSRGMKNRNGTLTKGFFNLESNPKGLAKEREWNDKSGAIGCRYHIELKNPNNVKHALELIEQKYNSLKG